MMARHYTAKRGTRRWPLAIFYDLIDMAAINASVLHTMLYPTISKKKGARRLFLLSLGKEMVEPEIERRMENPQKRTSTIRSAVVASGFQHLLLETSENPTRNPTKRARCSSCPQEKYQKTNQICDRRGDFVCQSHDVRNVLCGKCA